MEVTLLVSQKLSTELNGNAEAVIESCAVLGPPYFTYCLAYEITKFGSLFSKVYLAAFTSFSPLLSTSFLFHNPQVKHFMKALESPYYLIPHHFWSAAFPLFSLS